MAVIRYARQESGQGITEFGRLTVFQQDEGIDYPRGDVAVLRFQVIVRYHGEKALPHFVVGKIQQISIPAHVIVFDGEVTALVDHR